MTDASLSTLESISNELFRINRQMAEISRVREELQTRVSMLSDRIAEINPGDYIDDAAEYDAWLQNLEEEDGGGGGRRGAPPAAISAIEALETFEMGPSEKTIMVCAVCKDAMVLGEVGKKLPCEHCYHGSCILPWLTTRNSCPLCRFQLQTDDPQYERMKRRRVDY